MTVSDMVVACHRVVPLAPVDGGVEASMQSEFLMVHVAL